MRKVFAASFLLLFILLSFCNLTAIASPSTFRTKPIFSSVTLPEKIAVSTVGIIKATPDRTKPKPVTQSLIPDAGNAQMATVEPAFSSTVSKLNTPAKIEKYLLEHFHYIEHPGCYAYSPLEFFKLGHGNCKDYAVFIAYVLNAHGYYARIVTFSWYTTLGKPNGHVVVIYRDTDRKLRYFSNDTIISIVDSVDDLLQKEKTRFGAGRIGVHFVLSPGARNHCKQQSDRSFSQGN